MARSGRLARCALLAACLVAASAFAHESQLVSEPAQVPPRAQAPAGEAPVVDPMVKAILIAVAANLLREAAASPDPISTLGSSFERVLGNFVRSPQAAQLLQGLIGAAVRDVPEELREPLAQFAGSMLNGLRSDLLREPRTPRGN